MSQSTEDPYPLLKRYEIPFQRSFSLLLSSDVEAQMTQLNKCFENWQSELARGIDEEFESLTNSLKTKISEISANLDLLIESTGLLVSFTPFLSGKRYY